MAVFVPRLGEHLAFAHMFYDKISNIEEILARMGKVGRECVSRYP
jgi:hypothetical protein